MFRSTKLEAVIFTFAFHFSAHANITLDLCSAGGCGLQLYPSAIPALTVLDCGNPVSVTSQLINLGPSTVMLGSITLTANGDNAVSDGVSLGYGPSSCNPGNFLAANGPGPGTQCTVYLNFEPCNTGLLDYTYTVTPNSSQAPLVWGITASVTSGYSNAYVLNSGNNTLSLCPLNDDGSFGVCSLVDVLDSFDENLLDGPWNIALNPAADHAYISNATGNSVTICPINIDHSFGTCTHTPGFSNPHGLAFNNDGSLLYVSDKATNDVNICIVNGDASLGICTPTSTGTSPSGLLFINNGGLLLVTDAITPGQVEFYSVDGLGNLTYAGNRTGVGLSEPVALCNGLNHVYVSNSPFDTIGVCDQDTCTQDTANSLLNLPAGLEVIGETVYVSNQGQYEDLSYAITFCPMNSDGTFNDSGCVQLTDTTFNAPSDVLLVE